LALTSEFVTPRTSYAQAELGPRMGVYLPSGSLVKEGKSYQGGPIELQQVGAPLIGVQGMVWVRRWLALEATANVSPSMTAVTDSAGTRDHSGTLVLASTRVLVPVTSRRGAWAFHIGGGVGIVNRSGALWNMFQEGATARTWLVGFGGETALSPTLRMRFWLEDNISTAQFDQGLATETQARVHHDYSFAIDVAFPLHRQ